ncbi:phage tail family protein [Psychrobacillus sp. MER TA 17]|nr:phage tail family protein [Psychrobacillus sp. MER TA 17]
MDAIIERQDGQRVHLADLGIIVLDIRIPAATISSYGTNVPGRAGKVDKGSDYTGRTLEIDLLKMGQDLMDFPFIRNQIHYYLGGKDWVWLYEGRSLGMCYEFEQPGQESVNPFEVDNDYIYGMRYKIRSQGGFNVDQITKNGRATVTFDLIELPFAESTATTLQPFILDTKDSVETQAIWTVDRAQLFDEIPVYTVKGSGEFRIYNGGTEEVDPDEGMYLVITHKGASDGLTIDNLTNGSRFKYLDSTKTADYLVVNGTDVTKNNVNVVRRTEPSLLTLSEGWNRIKISNSLGGETSFDFRWYFR